MVRPTGLEPITFGSGGIYPVAVDSDYRIWEAFSKRYWPALYFIDAKGRIRHHYFGEYAEAERVLQELLKEGGVRLADESTVRVAGEGVEAAPSALGALAGDVCRLQQGRAFRVAGSVPKGLGPVLQRALTVVSQ